MGRWGNADALDHPRQHLAVGWFGLDLHEPSHSVRGCPISGGNSVDSAGLNIVRRSTHGRPLIDCITKNAVTTANDSTQDHEL